MGISGIGKTIFTQEQIQQRVAEVGLEINRDYQGKEFGHSQRPQRSHLLCS